ncbi:MAG: molecular chaperone Tir [Acidobacteriota bacterium]|nr:molecular chaperone Tir [Acidobacteriota bacterium]
MAEHFDKVKGYLLDLGLTIATENEADELVVVDDEENGIKSLFVDCEPPIVILEQLIGDVPADPGDLFVRLLQMNNTLVHGAFVLDESATRIFYRDTLQLANLDVNELEGSIDALSLAMAEYGAELLGYLKR